MSIKWVKYMWAFAFAMAIVLVSGAVCSYINIRCDIFSEMNLPHGISGTVVSAGCAAAYILLVLIMAKLIAEGAGRYMAAASVICIGYVIWAIVFIALRSFKGGFVVTAAIAVYTLILSGPLMLKDKVCGVLIVPVIMWHIYLSVMSLMVIRINL